ncbi:MAG: hypothetical protein FJW84_00240 [Actinobacteria bacterium]|nr:hypothetical protein [Actinomycetota bacterium]
MKLSKMFIIFITLTLSLFISSPSLADEVPAETPAETSAPAFAETTPAYEPPAEALNGVGGWAVVDPVTGNVHGVIVATIDTFRERNGVIGHEYMGCASNCVLRFQTRATDDGNVAGWHGTQTNIDANGNASQTNDGTVKWNESEKNFTIKNSSTDSTKEKVTRTQTLFPEKTASNGKNLHTGIVDINTEYESSTIAGQRVKGSTKQQNLEDKNSTINVEFQNWSEGKNFTYENPNLLVENIDSDVNNELNKDGFTTESKEDASNELVEESEDVIFVKAIKALTENVKSFFSSLFGFRTEITSKD